MNAKHDRDHVPWVRSGQQPPAAAEAGHLTQRKALRESWGQPWLSGSPEPLTPSLACAGGRATHHSLSLQGQQVGNLGRICEVRKAPGRVPGPPLAVVYLSSRTSSMRVGGRERSAPKPGATSKSAPGHTPQSEQVFRHVLVHGHLARRHAQQPPCPLRANKQTECAVHTVDGHSTLTREAVLTPLPVDGPRGHGAE